MADLSGSPRDSIKARALPAKSTPEQLEEELWKSTQFLAAARRFGLEALLFTPAMAVSVVLAGGAVAIDLTDAQAGTLLEPLAVAYLSVAVAMFGIVLAALAVASALFDEKYMAALNRRDVLTHSLFQFWWAAALSVASIVASTILLAGDIVWTGRTLHAVAVGAASFLFFAAIFTSLGRVGTLLRHAVYRARLR